MRLQNEEAIISKLLEDIYQFVYCIVIAQMPIIFLLLLKKVKLLK